MAKAATPQNAMNRSKLMAELKGKSKGAFQRAKKVEAKAGGASLPPGIRDGIAKASSWKMDRTQIKIDAKKQKTGGDIFFSLVFICVEPKEHDGAKCEGLRVTKQYFLNDSEYSTLEQNYERFCNDLQLLGIDTTTMKSDDEIPVALDEYFSKDNENYIFFNTTARRNKPGEVNYFIQGVCDSFGGSDDADAAQNGDPDTGSGSGWEAGMPCQVDWEGVMYPGEVSEVSDDGATITVSFEDGTSAEYEVDQVFAVDDAGDGGDDNSGDDTASSDDALGEWEVGNRVLVDYDGTDYAGEISEANDDGENFTITFDDGSSAEHHASELKAEEVDAEAQDDQTPWVPAVKDEYKYNGKLCSVTAVNEEKETVDLKTVKGGQVFKKIGWDKLAAA